MSAESDAGTAAERELTDDEKHLAKLGYSQELSRSWSSFSNFAISFSIISILAGCLTTFGQAWNERRPDRDLVGVADHLGLHPADRLHAERAGVGDTPPRGHLLVGSQARRPGRRLLHRLAQPDRPPRGDRERRLRSRDVPGPDDQHLSTGWADGYSLTRVFLLFVAILVVASLLNIFSGHLLAAHQQRLGLVARRRGRGRDPRARIRPADAPELRLRLHRRLNNSGFDTRRLTGSSSFRWASCSPSTRSPGSTPRSICPRRRRGRRRAQQGHLALDLLLGRRWLHPAARLHVRRPGPAGA